MVGHVPVQIFVPALLVNGLVPLVAMPFALLAVMAGVNAHRLATVPVTSQIYGKASTATHVN